MKGERVCVVNALACALVCLVAVYVHIRIMGVETQMEQAQAASFRSVEELQYQVTLHQRFTCGMLQWLVGSSSGLHGNTQASPMARSQLLSVLLSVQQHSASLLASCGEIDANGGQVVHLMRGLGSDSCGAGEGYMDGGGGVGSIAGEQRYHRVSQEQYQRYYQQQYQQKQQSGGCSGGVNGCIFRSPCVWAG